MSLDLIIEISLLKDRVGELEYILQHCRRCQVCRHFGNYEYCKPCDKCNQGGKQDLWEVRITNESGSTHRESTAITG